MIAMLNNYINGNLKEAKAQAKRFSYRAIIQAGQDEMGWSTDKAMGVADYLKGHISFQRHCETQARATVREDSRTGQYFPQVDGRDIGISTFDKDRAQVLAESATKKA